MRRVIAQCSVFGVQCSVFRLLPPKTGSQGSENDGLRSSSLPRASWTHGSSDELFRVCGGNLYGSGCDRDRLKSRVSGIARVESLFCVEIGLAESSLDKVLRRSVDDNAWDEESDEVWRGMDRSSRYGNLV